MKHIPIAALILALTLISIAVAILAFAPPELHGTFIGGAP